MPASVNIVGIRSGLALVNSLVVLVHGVFVIWHVANLLTMAVILKLQRFHRASLYIATPAAGVKMHLVADAVRSCLIVIFLV